MNYQETDDECPGCGATAGDRKRNKPGEPQGLEECPHCGAKKCCMCDMGDDVECARAVKTKKLTDTQIGVLRLIADGKSAYTFCNGRAEHGARTCTVMALQRRGYVKAFEITEEGRAALNAALAQAA